MNAKELRIGNYFNQFGNIHQVTWDILKDLDNAPEEQLYCKPIPLTEEWLIKLGFEQQVDLISNRTLLCNGGDNGFDCAVEFIKDCDSVFMYKDKFYFIIDVNTDDFGDNYTSKEVKYVHQLQNLYFALTGEELTQ